ncbi:MAG: flagellar motor protein MotB [Acetatifactor sp.]|nr:flagellar motor protein MotB [Acetatifactor sp.]
MAKKKQEDPPAGSPAWMATFSDLMNLLFCFFVLLFSMSTMDEAKYNEMVAAMNSTFSIFQAGATAIGEGILISSGVSQLNNLDDYINEYGKAADSDKDVDALEEFVSGASEEQLQDALESKYLQSNEEIAEKIEEAVSENNMSDQIEVSFTAQYVQLSMKGALLFDSGSAELKDSSESVLLKVGVILEKYAEGTIEIDGHTDNVPIKSARFADNEELSSARALSVFYYLANNTSIDEANMVHAGMGDRDPIADNGTADGRSKNRRVEIKIYNPS